MEYTWQRVYDITLIVRILYYTATVIQIFKTYTITRIPCYIGIISRILTDSYRMNKREYLLHVFIESLYNDIREIYSKNIQENLENHPYSVRKRKYTVQKNPVFMVVLWSVPCQFNFFKDRLPQILLGTFFNNLSCIWNA